MVKQASREQDGHGNCVIEPWQKFSTTEPFQNRFLSFDEAFQKTFVEARPVKLQKHQKIKRLLTTRAICVFIVALVPFKRFFLAQWQTRGGSYGLGKMR